MIVYQARNKINGKCYIGRTSRPLADRRKDHERGSKRPKQIFHHALKKYGKENFEWSILVECATSEEMYEAERRLIKEVDTLAPRGYNTTDGGDGGGVGEGNSFFGKKHTAESKRKISESRRGQCMGEDNPSKRPEVGVHISQKLTGQKRTEEAKEKMRDVKLRNREKFVVTFPDGREQVICGIIKFCKSLDIVLHRQGLMGTMKTGRKYKGFSLRPFNESDGGMNEWKQNR